jgi:hypothetical protein
METIAEAEKALARNWRAAAFYMAGSVLVVMIYVYCDTALDALVPEDLRPKPVWYVAVTLLMDVALTGIIAGLQSVVFASMGAEIDRPLWKNSGHTDALRRFLPLWFIISLIYLAMVRMQGSLYDQGLESASATLLLPRILWSCAYIPIGVCIMHGGKLVWEEIPDRLAPIIHHAPQAAVAFGLGFLQFLVWDVIIATIPEAYHKSALVLGLANAPLILLECLAFVVMWHVCMAYRDTAPERGDDDFDF